LNIERRFNRANGVNKDAKIKPLAAIGVRSVAPAPHAAGKLEERFTGLKTIGLED